MLSGTYRIPAYLKRTETELQRVLVVGSCLSVALLGQFKDITQADHVLFNNVSELPDAPPHPIDHYDFQVIQIGRRLNRAPPTRPTSANWRCGRRSEEGL